MPAVPLHRAADRNTGALGVNGSPATTRARQPEMIRGAALLELQAGPRCRRVAALRMRRLHVPAASFPFDEVHATAYPLHGKDWLTGARGARGRVTIPQSGHRGHCVGPAGERSVNRPFLRTRRRHASGSSSVPCVYMNAPPRPDERWCDFGPLRVGYDYSPLAPRPGRSSRADTPPRSLTVRPGKGHCSSCTAARATSARRLRSGPVGRWCRSKRQPVGVRVGSVGTQSPTRWRPDGVASTLGKVLQNRR